MDTGEYYLIDLGSRNGSFINGRRVSVPVTLHNGDAITFGQTELKFYCPALETASISEYGATHNATATAALHVRRLISVLVVDIREGRHPVIETLSRDLEPFVPNDVVMGEASAW